MRWLVVAAFLALAATSGAGLALAQAYQPGQQVEYKAENWPETWKTGVYVRALPGGSQVLIREVPTSVTRGGRAYQRQEYAGLAGSLNISPGGTYVWNSPSGVLRGNWRPATQAEMSASDKGGEGVVLLNARSGGDWLVHKRTEEGPEGTGIMIRDLATRNQRVRGTR